MRKTILLLGFCGQLICMAQQTDVLFIGNSYTAVNDLPNTFRLLALSLGDTVNVAASSPGGYTFQGHTAYAPTLQAIGSQAWDHVVLQEQSQLPSFPPAQVETQCYPFAAELVDLIRANDSCTQPVFYMTWGRQNGDASNCASWPPVCTYDGMQARLRESYLEMAFANDAYAAPVGTAWKNVRDAHPAIVLYDPDQSHPSPAGTYLAACVFYSTIFRESSEASTFSAAIDPATASILRGIASSTVLDSLDTWNIGVNDPDADFTWTHDGNGLVQFNHGGAGEHVWSFSDGGSATDPAPAHQFGTGGLYTVSHTWTDACGRTASAETTVDLSITGIACTVNHDPIGLIAIGNGQARLVRSQGTQGELSIIDALGRTLRRMAVYRNEEVIDLPKGICMWHWTDVSGHNFAGRTLIH